MLKIDDTIAALASAPGPAQRGILRLSGAGTNELLQRWIPGLIRSPRGAAVRYPVELTIQGARAPIACDLQWWPTPRSYTGQPLAELHLPGSPPLLQVVLAELFQRGARPAQRGEFTLRAFLAGRLDLLQAEAVLGVIDATDHAELETALSQLSGGISQRLSLLRIDLLELLADLEAGLDFVDEHIEFVSHEEICRRVREARSFVETLYVQSQERSVPTERWRVVLGGLPNAGKSTLFNALVGENAALVSPMAGTTRDYLVGRWNCAGIDVDLVDTAGWDDIDQPLERAMGAARNDQLNRADLILWCTELRWGTTEVEQVSQSQAALQEFLESRTGTPPLVQQIVTKCDDWSFFTPGSSLSVSAVTREGLTELRERVRSLLSQSGHRHWLGASAVRCQESLRGALAALNEAEEVAFSTTGEELIAAELRLALEHLGAIVGEVYTDDLLDRIFSKFCIGK